MQTAVKSFIKLMTRRSRNGQALVIVAVAMLALIGFVGIAVDTAMLFARYSALRRAVDAAAIAAASHVNQNTTYASLQSIAVQYIRLHGLDPSSVLVETCETEIDEFVGTKTSQPNGNLLVNTNAPLSTILSYANTPPPYGTPINGVAMNFPSELCKASPVKVLRVSAQIQSQTSFLSLLGWKTVTLVSSSLAQTAVLDVALLLDTSSSESADTYSSETSQGLNENEPASSGLTTYNASYPCSAGTTTDGKTGSTAPGKFCTHQPGNLWNVCQAGIDNFPLPVNDPVTHTPSGLGQPPTCFLNSGLHRSAFQSSIALHNCSPQPTCDDDLKNTNIVALANFRDFTDTSNDPAFAQPYPGWPSGAPGYPGAMVGDTGTGHYIPGLGLIPYGQDADNTGYIDPSKPADINFLPQPVNVNGVTLTPGSGGNVNSPLAIRPECYLGNGASAQIANYAWAGCCNDPTLQSNTPQESTNGVSSGVDYAWDKDPNWYVCDPTDLNQQSIININGSQPLNNTCGLAAGSGTGAKVVGTQTNETRNIVPGVFPSGYGYTSIKNPAYYGVTTQANASVATANNPTAHGMLYQGGDGNYSDLVCQPFKQVRDAARRFIKKLDFVRGDRLMIINFDESAHEEYPFDPTTKKQIQQPITDKNSAIRTLNYLVGVDVNPAQTQSGCLARNWGPYFRDGGNYNNNYFVQSQCQDTNTGEAILDATSVLTDARWMRRESVWTMVLLTDGYPNRTTSQMNTTNLGGASDHNWLNVFEPSQFGQSSPTTEFCDPNAPTTATDGANCVCNPDYGVPSGTPPVSQDYSVSKGGVSNPGLAGNPTGTGGFVAQYGYVICTKGKGGPDLTQLTSPYNVTLATTGRIPFAYTGDDSGQIKTSYGFCPWWTFCSASGSSTNAQICQQAADGYPVKYNQGTDPGLYAISNAPSDKTNGISGFTQCDDVDPFARHFCSNMDGVINPGSPIEGSALCDPHYDPMDFARDRADFAGLLNYTPTVPGDFIAMFGILFKHNDINSTDSSIGINILGVQFLHYLSDAGDNGNIDNHLQAWYRKHHFNNTASNEGPTRLPQEWTNFANLTYDGRNAPGTVFAADKLTDPEDPCAQYDYPENTDPTKPGADLALNSWAVGTIPGDATYNAGLTKDLPGGSLYEGNATQTCGQYFFANNLSTINTAFTEIAGRLFTRLAR